jgi:predicted nucleotidyltransferase component of viral defense system
MENQIQSIKSRLKNIAVSMQRDNNFILQLYFQERFLYRLSVSGYKENFVLKGGLLIFALNKNMFRTTKDIDFLAKNIPGNIEDIQQVIKTIAEIECDDGVQFDSGSLTAAIIKEGADYTGTRIKIKGNLGNIIQNLTIDIALGDKITPGPETFSYPVLLEQKIPYILAYNYESVIAEKIEAICKLGVFTSRMKDFYDILFIKNNKSFNVQVLREAIKNTFQNRQTDRSLFFDLDKDVLWDSQEKMWAEFLNKIKEPSRLLFKEVRKHVFEFLREYF